MLPGIREVQGQLNNLANVIIVWNLNDQREKKRKSITTQDEFSRQYQTGHGPNGHKVC